MQYFTVQAPTSQQALEKMKREYGDQAMILTQKNFRQGGVFGIFAKPKVEITGYISQSPSRKRAVEQEKKRILESARKEQVFQQLLGEIKALRQDIDRKETADQPQAIARVEELLKDNDFSENFIASLLKRLSSTFSLEDLDDQLLIENSLVEWIGEKIRLYPPLFQTEHGKKIFIIVGPTGVGKTTTIAKLAAIYGLGNDKLKPKKVHIVTVDNYRIAAKDQIATYAEIMRLPVSMVESFEDFKKIIALNEDAELILVDTIGRSPKDLAKLAEMKDIIAGAGSECETHLAVSASTKSSDVEEILKQFEPFGYNSVIITKLDETSRVGNIISVLAGRNKAISYLSDGQKVPQDLEAASVLRLLLSLEGFRINRDKLEKKFGEMKEISGRYWS
jgi:flagellar biosynthesis protein FlhF